MKQNSQGYGFKIGKLIINFGYIPAPNDAGKSIVFPIKYSQAPMVQIGTQTAINHSAINTNPHEINTSAFRIAHNYESSNIAIHWLAIGY